MAQRRTVTRKRVTGRKKSGGRLSAFDKFIDKLRLYKELTAKVKTGKQEQDILRSEVTEYLLSQKDPKSKGGVTLAGVDKYGARHQATLVEGVNHNLDRDGLRGDLPEDIWHQCHELVFSEQRLEDLVARGVIDKDTVQKHIHDEPRTPYPKIS